MAAIVLLIAFAKVAHLLLVRTREHRRQMAVRMAAGAGRFRLFVQQLTERPILESGHEVPWRSPSVAGSFVAAEDRIDVFVIGATRQQTRYRRAAMIEGIRDFFARVMRPIPSADVDDAQAEEAARRRLHVAACALLLELAHADDEFSEAERTHVRESLRRHLDLDEATVSRLLELAEEERASAIDLYQFTSLVRDHYDLAQKTLLAEIMWGVVLADGTVEEDESYMLRKIGNLLDLEPGFLAHARKQVRKNRG